MKPGVHIKQTREAKLQMLNVLLAGAWDQGSEDNIWAQGGGSNRGLGKPERWGVS